MRKPRRSLRAMLAAMVATTLMVSLAAAPTAQAGARGSTRISSGPRFTDQQRAVLYGIAKDTWNFYRNDVDPNTHLPLDNLGPGGTRGSTPRPPMWGRSSGPSSRRTTSGW